MPSVSEAAQTVGRWREAIAVARDDETVQEHQYLEPGEVQAIQEDGFGHWWNMKCIEVSLEGTWSFGKEKDCIIYFLTAMGGPAIRVAVHPFVQKAWVEVKDWFTAWEKITDAFSTEEQAFLAAESGEIVEQDEEARAVFKEQARDRRAL